jgi:threonine dehydratase
MKTAVTLHDVYQAQARLAGLVRHTPLEPAPALGARVWLKLENLQHTRSFKLRGAANAIAGLSDADRPRGVITASAGNHAQGLAAAGQVLGVRVVTVMPEDTPNIKVKRTRELGAQTLLFGSSYDAAEAQARHLEKKMGLTFVSAYNHPQVVAGQGTIALEILADLPEIARVLVPVGGGGLVSGIGLALKSVNPGIQVIGVQSVATPALYNYIKDTSLPQAQTLAEGLAGHIEAGSITLELSHQVMDDIVLVEEKDIGKAIRWLLSEHSQVVEGAGAVGVAALLSGRVVAGDSPLVIIISGGNIDYETLRQLVCGRL